MSVLFLNPLMCAPESPFYGKTTKSFKLSLIKSCDGKCWQLRTIHWQGQYFIVPFILNSGGVDSFAPIVHSRVIKAITGLDRSVLGDQSHKPEYDRMTSPSPLGEVRAFSDWDDARARVIEEKSPDPNDLRWNLIGHGFAGFCFEVKQAAGSVVDGDVSRERAVDKLIERCTPEKNMRNYIQNPCNRHRVERELDAMVVAWRENRDEELNELAEIWAKS